MAQAATPQHHTHPIPPVFDARSEVLILGSFPSPASREYGFFYGHPRNRMWDVLGAVFQEPTPSTIQRKRDFLLRHHIAMWDVLASCTVVGARDSSIANEVPNDFRELFDIAPIRTVLCAGSTAARLYRKHCEQAVGMPCEAMPSTSPANAAASMSDLVGKWQLVRECVTREERPVLDVPDVVALEQAIAKSGTSLAELMDRAGTHLAYRVHAHNPYARVVVLAGSGNNGGDGWVAARMLGEWGHEVSLVSAKPAAQVSAQPAHDAACAATAAFDQLGVQLVVDLAYDELHRLLCDADVVVDAILGTGFAHDTVRPPYESWVQAACAAHAAGAYVVAADCPSGLSAQTGAAADPCIQADETVTMIVSKPGLHTGLGPAKSGNVHIAPLCDIAYV